MKTLFKIAIGCSGLVCLLSSPSILLAADPAAQDDIEIIITAGRKAQTADNTLAPVSVISRRDIETSQASSVVDVLQQVPGLSMVSSGGLGKQTSMHLRGTGDKHVLVLIDGVKVGSATLGTTAFEYLPLDQVERIEIVRGPRSSLYGSEAIGGVIQIFTRRGSGSKGIRPEASVSYGSHNTRKGSVNLSGGTADGSWFNLNAATVRTDGINVLDFYTSYPTSGPVKVTEPDKDGYTNNSVGLRAGHRFGNGASAEVSAMHSKGNSEYDGGLQNSTDFTQQVLSGKVSVPVSTTGTVMAQVGQSKDHQSSFKDAAFSSRFNTKRNTASVQMDTRLGDTANVTVGADYLKDKIDASNTYTVTSRNNTGVFASYQAHIGDDNKLDVSARRDHNQQFGNKTTGGIAFAHEFGSDVRGTISYGTAFKAPTFNDLYYPRDGNPKLTPENSRNIELGVAGRLNSGEWSINAFQNKITDLIEWQDVGNNVWKPMNVDSAQIQGVEFAASTRVGDWSLSANATVQKPEVNTGSNKGKVLIFRPERMLNLNVDRDFGQFSLGGAVHAESRRYTDAFNSGQLPGFGTLDLHAKYSVSKDVAVGLKLGNVLDKDYRLNRNYNQDGRNALLTLEYKPQ